MKKFLKLAWRNMWRNWRRTSIALVAIVVGLVLLLFMDGMIDGSDQAIYGNAVRLYGGNIQVHAPGYRARASRMPLYTLEDPDAVVQAALSQPQVVAAAKRIQTAGIVSDGKDSFPVIITALEPAVEAPISIQAENTKQGRFLLEGDGDAIVIGRGLAEELALKVGDRVTLLGRSKREMMRQHTMTIVGIYDLGMREAEKGAVFITLPEAQTLYNLRDQVTEVSITLESVGQEQTVVPALQAALPGYEVDTWDTLKPELQGTMDTKLAFTSFFGLVVVGIACIGILNILMMAVFERTREMGVLAALGLKNRQLMGLFLLEGTLIGAFGALLGCLLGGALLIYMGQVGMDFSFAAGMGEITALMGDRIYPTLSLVNTLNRSLTVVVIAALASLYPAWQAAHKEPAAALHQV
jgi:ABC-type lipoprotein release transport system permease subunit